MSLNGFTSFLGSSVVVESCQVCGTKNLETVLFLGYLPPVNQMRQIGLATTMYADDNSDWLVNNHGVPETLARRDTWANNVQDW